MAFQSSLFRNTDESTKKRLEQAARNAPTIRVGERHREAVRTIQRALLELGFRMSAGADGLFGPQTRNATRAFQRKNHLGVDGIVGRNTMAALDARLAAAAPSSPFQVHVRFLGGLSNTQQQIFTLAAERWSEIVTADVPDVPTDVGVVDDLLIDASGVPIDNAGGVLGQAGPTLVRNGSLIPARGVMEFDTADLQTMEDNGSLVNVIIHEMGHVLGIGTLWSAHNLIEGSGTNDPLFSGSAAMSEFASLLGVPEPQLVPLANQGGPGTAEGHWRENVFDEELMTGFLDSGTNPLSRLTIASLEDIGYQVDADAADAYALPSALKLAARDLGRHTCCNIRIPTFEITKL